MYDEELDMALEDAYDDGYVQALLDMDADIDDIAEEDVDIFDDNYFDEAMEGPAREYRRKMNAGKTPEQINDERAHKFLNTEDPNYSVGKHDDWDGQRHFNNRHNSLYGIGSDDEVKRIGRYGRRYRDYKVRKHDTDEIKNIRYNNNYKYADKAANKVISDYNERTKAEAEELRRKLKSPVLTPTMKRDLITEFKTRKGNERHDTMDQARAARDAAYTRARMLRARQQAQIRKTAEELHRKQRDRIINA